MRKNHETNIIRTREKHIHIEQKEMPAQTRDTNNQPAQVAKKSIAAAMIRRKENTMRNGARKKLSESAINSRMGIPPVCFFQLYHRLYTLPVAMKIIILVPNSLFIKKFNGGRRIPGREPMCQTPPLWLRGCSKGVSGGVIPAANLSTPKKTYPMEHFST